MVAWLGRALVALLSAAVVATVGFGWHTYRTAADDVVRDDVITAAPEAATRSIRDLPRTARTILLVGMDSRTDAHGDPLPREVLDALRAGDATGEQNTDTMVLVHLPADPERKAFALSLPRDSYVDIAGGLGRHKLNSAFARGRSAAGTGDAAATTAGRRTLIATVQELTGLPVDHYAEINLFGFSELTNAVGGVPVCLTEAVRDRYSGAEFPAGQQTLTGVDALRFVRQRHGLPGGDLDRVRRQQAFLAGLAHRMFSSGTLASPARVTDLVDALTKAVVLDADWDLVTFATQLATLTGDDLQFSTIPTGRVDLPTPSDGSAVEVDLEQVRAYVRTLLDPPPATAPAPPQPAAPQPPPITAAHIPCVH